jgi:hypothetical protein
VAPLVYRNLLACGDLVARLPSGLLEELRSTCDYARLRTRLLMASAMVFCDRLRQHSLEPMLVKGNTVEIGASHSLLLP